MNRREASKLETRQLILNAAKKLFLEKGVELCTMRGIAKKAGVSPASVVVHFKNKTALLETALLEDVERNIELAITSLPPERDLYVRIMHIWKAMFFFYDKNRDLYRALISRTAYLPDKESPNIARQMEEFLQFVGAMIRQEQALGNVSPDIDVRIAAYNFAALYFGALMGFFRDPAMAPQTAVDTLGEMVKQCLNGIMTNLEEK
ncbi:MAG: TetR/AcrR family transcriptional regulator [Thermodesulfobacteriota bacterium]|nr:TetR/AcrR family transcriptional regulator [Thermodesulfobacteriota bacterium]